MFTVGDPALMPLTPQDHFKNINVGSANLHYCYELRPLWILRTWLLNYGLDIAEACGRMYIRTAFFTTPKRDWSGSPQFKFNELNSRAASNFGSMWIKCSFLFFCFLSSQIIGLFLLYSCLRVPFDFRDTANFDNCRRFSYPGASNFLQALPVRSTPFFQSTQ